MFIHKCVECKNREFKLIEKDNLVFVQCSNCFGLFRLTTNGTKPLEGIFLSTIKEKD
jgi:hypothetical protein